MGNQHHQTLLKASDPLRQATSPLVGRWLQPRQEPVPMPAMSELKLPTYKARPMHFRRSVASAPTKFCAEANTVGAEAADLQGKAHGFP